MYMSCGINVPCQGGVTSALIRHPHRKLLPLLVAKAIPRCHQNRWPAAASALSGDFAPGAEADANPRAGDQVSQVAALLHSQVEALTAINVELLQTALIGTATARAQGGAGPPQSPEAALEALHTAVLAAQRDSMHLMGEAEREAWQRAAWDVYHVVQAGIQRLLFELHALGADMGSSKAALMAGACLSEGLLVPRNAEEAFRWYTRASSMGSAAASLKCGVHYFSGQPPAGQDDAKAYEYFSRALDQAEADLGGHRGRMAQRSADFDALLAEERDAVVGVDRAYLEVLEEQRSTALTWLGRCYLEGCGVPRDVARAAQLFRQAGNREELQELAMLKQQFALLDLAGVDPRPAEG